MSDVRTERLKKYLSQIAKRHDGAGAVIEMLEASAKRGSASGFESIDLESRKAPHDLFDKAKSGLSAMQRGESLTPDQQFGLEALILPRLRPAIDIIDGAFTSTHVLWTKLSDDAAIRNRIMAAVPAVGRIELKGVPRVPYGGTGFVVGNGLIMTNRHVAEIFASGLGDRTLTLVSGVEGGINFKRELGRPDAQTLTVRRVVMIHPFWDMAILSVDGISPEVPIQKLSLLDAREMAEEEIFVIGYPAYDPRNPGDEQDKLFGSNYGVKRLQPGLLQGGKKTASFGKLVDAATHDCSTLGGNSGSPVYSLQTGDLVALHFGGIYQKDNFAVPLSELARDDRVIRAGVQFAERPQGGVPPWNDWWLRADATEAFAPAQNNVIHAPPAVSTPIVLTSGDISFDIPLRITISLGQPGKPASAIEAVAVAGLEAMREPESDPDYANRTGYNADFLNIEGQAEEIVPVSVAFPTALDPLSVAPTLSGGSILHYENFSLVMHAKRRLALFTASNVTKEPALKKPEPGQNYTRRGLSGLGPNDMEKWFADPRLDNRYQLPDVFFTKDRGSFDKGHIVRRDDVAWGATYAKLKRANGDSYHVTNCSPQVAGFNRAANGEDNWGDLENHVLSEAANERLCVFAGPVLAVEDQMFSVKGPGGTVIAARIPQRYWKVIVARSATELSAYGFVLDQDLQDVRWEEFTVPPEFEATLTSIADIERLTGVIFPQNVRDADQSENQQGTELARRAGARTGKRKP